MLRKAPGTTEALHTSIGVGSIPNLLELTMRPRRVVDTRDHIGIDRAVVMKMVKVIIPIKISIPIQYFSRQNFQCSL